MYQMIADGNYPGTDLPVFKVFDADEYADVTRTPRPVGEVWAVGVKGVSGKFVPTGTRYALTGSWAESPVLPIGAYADAAREMVKAL